MSNENNFPAVLDEMRELHDRKRQDYGTEVDGFANVRASEDFGIPGWLGSVMRANDKMSRLKRSRKPERWRMKAWKTR